MWNVLCSLQAKLIYSTIFFSDDKAKKYEVFLLIAFNGPKCTKI